MVFRTAEAGETSPFSFARAYAMDNSRATRLGYPFTQARQWLPNVAAERLGVHGRPLTEAQTITPADSSTSSREALSRSSSKALRPPRSPNSRLARAM